MSLAQKVQTNPLRGLHLVRLVAATLLLGLTVCCAGYLGMATDSVLVEITTGAFVALVAGALLEWYFHVFLCHFDWGFQRGIYKQHHRSHHKLGSPPMNKPLWLRLGEQFVGQFLLAILVLGLPTWLITNNPVMVLALVVTSLLVSFSIAFLHHCYHGELGSLKLRSSHWFRKFQARHLAHHRDLSRNFNVVLPIADIAIGTYSRGISRESC